MAASGPLVACIDAPSAARANAAVPVTSSAVRPLSRTWTKRTTSPCDTISVVNAPRGPVQSARVASPVIARRASVGPMAAAIAPSIDSAAAAGALAATNTRPASTPRHAVR